MSVFAHIYVSGCGCRCELFSLCRNSNIYFTLENKIEYSVLVVLLDIAFSYYLRPFLKLYLFYNFYRSEIKTHMYLVIPSN